MMTQQEQVSAVLEKMFPNITIRQADHIMSNGVWYKKPDLLHSLDAMAQAEALLTEEEWPVYIHNLGSLTGAAAHSDPSSWVKDLIKATCELRLPSLCRTWWPERFTA